MVSDGRPAVTRVHRLGDTVGGHARVKDVPRDFESRGGRFGGMTSSAKQPPAWSKIDGDARAYVVGMGKRTGHEYLSTTTTPTGCRQARQTCRLWLSWRGCRGR